MMPMVSRPEKRKGTIDYCRQVVPSSMAKGKGGAYQYIAHLLFPQSACFKYQRLLLDIVANLEACGVGMTNGRLSSFEGKDVMGV